LPEIFRRQADPGRIGSTQLSLDKPLLIALIIKKIPLNGGIMASAVRWVLFILTTTTLFGCSANDLLLKRQTETEARVERLTQADQKNLQQLNMQAGQILSLSEQIQSMTTQISLAEETLRTLRSAQEELAAKTSLLAKQASTPKVELVNPAASSKLRDLGPPAEYIKAFGLYSANNFTAAIEAFQQFLKSFPDSEYSPNAAYWIGECHYSLSDLSAALTSFRGVTESYPKSAKVPDALLKQGYTLAAMKEKEKAQVVFQSIIKGYPSSSAAAKARERLSAH
jgi:tol-pal system protein YbgF